MNQILISMLSGIISAAAASAVVFFFTTAKLRKERGFDRRLMWCESMMRAINAAGNAVSSASKSPNPGACWSEATRLYYKELIPLCGLKEIYAPHTAILEIRAFMRALETLITARSDGDTEDSASTASEPCLTDLRRAAASLSKIARSHLGLEPLPDSMTDAAGRFSDSFKCQALGKHGNPSMNEWTIVNEVRI